MSVKALQDSSLPAPDYWLLRQTMTPARVSRLLLESGAREEAEVVSCVACLRDFLLECMVLLHGMATVSWVVVDVSILTRSFQLLVHGYLLKSLFVDLEEVFLDVAASAHAAN